MNIRLSSALLVLSAIAVVARAEVAWGAGGGRVDEIVADSATIAPVRAKLPFVHFRYPHVDEKENVTFIADDPFYIGGEAAKQTHGIYRSDAETGEIKLLVGPETWLSGGGYTNWIRGLQSDGAVLVFHARVSERDNQPRRDALYRWSSEKGLTKIAAQGEPAPGGGVFARLGYAALDDERALFTGLVVAGDQSRHGLFLADLAAGRTKRLALGGPAQPFQLFWYQEWMADGVISMGALDADGREGLWYATPAPRPDPSAPATADRPAVVSERPLVFERLDLSAAPVPEGVTINFVENTATSRGWIAFNAGHMPDPDRKGYGGAFFTRKFDYKGVFLARDGRILNIADTETFIPGRDATFTDFRFWTTCQHGRVVFVAHGPDGFQAVYLYDAADDALYPLVSTDDLIDGRRPINFEVGARPLVGERCAFTAEFDAGGDKLFSGVYLATLHRTATRQLTRK